jgi:NitT/TauT family transport system ATP-binding protein
MNPELINLRGVCQSYGKRVVIDDFNLLIEDKPSVGEFIVLLGPSGCGKSTILRYIAGLQDPTSGEVTIKGKSRTGFIPMVFQQYSNIPWLSVLDNVLLPTKFLGKPQENAQQRALEMIQRVGLRGHENKFAQDTLLSGGQLQRVAIARSLMANAEVLLMDEPFGALDLNTRLQMQLLLAEIWKNLQSTVVFVTHDIQEAVFLGDDIYLMSANPGKIVKHWVTGLPLTHDRTIRHEKKFTDLVSEIEDTMFALIEGQK